MGRWHSTLCRRWRLEHRRSGGLEDPDEQGRAVGDVLGQLHGNALVAAALAWRLGVPSWTRTGPGRCRSQCLSRDGASSWSPTSTGRCTTCRPGWAGSCEHPAWARCRGRASGPDPRTAPERLRPIDHLRALILAPLEGRRRQLPGRGRRRPAGLGQVPLSPPWATVTGSAAGAPQPTVGDWSAARDQPTQVLVAKTTVLSR